MEGGVTQNPTKLGRANALPQLPGPISCAPDPVEDLRVHGAVGGDH